MGSWQGYAKAIVALVVAVLTAIVAGVGNGDIGDLGTYDWIKIALLVLGGTAATWFAQNVTGLAGGIIKAFLAAGTAGLTALAVGFENDNVWSQGELLTAVAASLVALTLTYQVPNAEPDTAAVIPTVDVGTTRKPA